MRNWAAQDILQNHPRQPFLMSDQLLAFLVADSADGVRRVVSEIKAPVQLMEVESKRAGELAMASKSKLPITRTIAKSLKGQPEFNSVDVSVIHGSVRLTGSVPSSWDRLRAALISRSTPGARSVEDELAVE